MSLQELGWSPYFQALWADCPLRPARVISQGSDRFLVHDGSRELPATVRSRLRDQEDFSLVVGDWVGLNPASPTPVGGSRPVEECVIEKVSERRTAIIRKQAGRTFGAQVLAANVDRVLLVMALDQDFSVHRLERYLTLVWDSGATPVIVLSKADLAADETPFAREAGQRAPGFPVICISNVSGQGLDQLKATLAPQETVVLLGSSGVGKSTLVNALDAGAQRATATVRQSDGKGRHTTTDRHLFRLPSGVLMIDTPGLREVQLWADKRSLDRTFAEIADAGAACRFRDCRHSGEPGCAVAGAVEQGEIDPDRLRSFHQLQAELNRLERQNDPRLASAYKNEVKKLHRAQKQQQRLSKKP
jgi:ribosome biogenesis GTPase / thiamine phosphate phosphatase